MAGNNFCKSLAFLFLFFLAEPNPQSAQPKTNLEKEINNLKNLLRNETINTDIFKDQRFKIYDIAKLFRKERKINYLSKEFGFYTEASFQEGLKFLNDYAELFRNAEKKFKVSKENIVSILKIESNLGKTTGKRPLLNTFASMYASTKRKDFAFGEIKSLLTQKEIKPFTLGSYGGAFGYSQSIPSSWIKFAVDFDSNGIKDPFSVADAIGFVANYLNYHGFKHNKEKAIFSYNHDTKYVKAIIDYAEELKKRNSKKKNMEKRFELVSADLSDDRLKFRETLKQKERKRIKN